MKAVDSRKLSDEQFDLYLAHELDQQAAEQAKWFLLLSTLKKQFVKQAS